MKPNKEVKLYTNRSIIRFEGTDFLGQVGIDGRIFKALTLARISVGVISQQAIENGLSILVQSHEAQKAIECLELEFKEERITRKVRSIFSIDAVSVLAFECDDYGGLSKELARNAIFPLILSQVSSENRVNIVVTSSQDEKAKSIIESELFGKPKIVHLAIIGHGNVGGTLIEQILDSRNEIRRRKNLDLRIVCIANSEKQVFNPLGLDSKWRAALESSAIPMDLPTLVKELSSHQLENLIAVDNTGSKDFVQHYAYLVENGFDLVSSNKIFNTLPIETYRSLRKLLAKNTKRYLYETNVGAGLPLIDTIKLLHLSGENITRIKGVFSGSLSYLFNQYSQGSQAFSQVLSEAIDKGFTEPDPREDLCGMDVARKLLILARELDLENELADIDIENLIPESLRSGSKESFFERLSQLDSPYEARRKSLKQGHVLRYVGDLYGDLNQEKGKLEVKLVELPVHSPLGQLKGSDSVFEIYTESYAQQPIVIMGAGAGAKVTARGVFGDLLRISDTK